MSRNQPAHESWDHNQNNLIDINETEAYNQWAQQRYGVQTQSQNQQSDLQQAVSYAPEDPALSVQPINNQAYQPSAFNDFSHSRSVMPEPLAQVETFVQPVNPAEVLYTPLQTPVSVAYPELYTITPIVADPAQTFIPRIPPAPAIISRTQMEEAIAYQQQIQPALTFGVFSGEDTTPVSSYNNPYEFGIFSGPDAGKPMPPSLPGTFGIFSGPDAGKPMPPSRPGEFGVFTTPRAAPKRVTQEQIISNYYPKTVWDDSSQTMVPTPDIEIIPSQNYVPIPQQIQSQRSSAQVYQAPEPKPQKPYAYTNIGEPVNGVQLVEGAYPLAKRLTFPDRKGHAFLPDRSQKAKLRAIPTQGGALRSTTENSYEANQRAVASALGQPQNLPQPVYETHGSEVWPIEPQHQGINHIGEQIFSKSWFETSTPALSPFFKTTFGEKEVEGTTDKSDPTGYFNHFYQKAEHQVKGEPSFTDMLRYGFNKNEYLNLVKVNELNGNVMSPEAFVDEHNRAADAFEARQNFRLPDINDNLNLDTDPTFSQTQTLPTTSQPIDTGMKDLGNGQVEFTRDGTFNVDGGTVTISNGGRSVVSRGGSNGISISNRGGRNVVIGNGIAGGIRMN